MLILVDFNCTDDDEDFFVFLNTKFYNEVKDLAYVVSMSPRLYISQPASVRLNGPPTISVLVCLSHRFS
jgi:hypothetical protein